MRGYLDRWVPTDEGRQTFESLCPEITDLIAATAASYLPKDETLLSEAYFVGFYAVDRFVRLGRFVEGEREVFAFVATLVRRHIGRLRRDGRSRERRLKLYAAGATPQVYVMECPPTQRVNFMAWRRNLHEFWSRLSPEERGILCLRTMPPPELVVLQRNLLARRAYMKNLPPCVRALSMYTGMDRTTVRNILVRTKTRATALRRLYDRGVA